MYTSKLAIPASPQLAIVTSLSQAIRSSRVNYKTLPHDYIVGGYVRDLLYGLPSSDIDVEVYGLSWDTLDTLLRTTFGAAHIVPEKAFALWNITHGGHSYTYSLPRFEKKSGTTHTGFDITADPELPMATAVKRRDYTINTLLLDPITSIVSDYTTGLCDIQRRCLRAVDMARLAEDPLRAWRAIQLVGRFDLTIEAQTEQTLRALATTSEVGALSGPRVRDELDKLLAKSANPSHALNLAHAWGLLSAHLPELITAIPSAQEWTLLLSALDGIQHADEHTQLHLRWQCILGNLSLDAASTLCSRLSIPKYLRTT